ncbi:hypothetical protein ACOMHN_016678 [Nucella lapillus]
MPPTRCAADPLCRRPAVPPTRCAADPLCRRPAVLLSRFIPFLGDTSQNESVASSTPLSDTPRDLTPRHRLHDIQDPVCRGGENNNNELVTERLPLPRTRKVAAGPPIPCYKGFSEAQMDPKLQAAVKNVNRLMTPKNKQRSAGGGGGGGSGKVSSSTDPVHSAIQTQLKAHGYHNLPTTSSSSAAAQPSSTSRGGGGEKPRKTARLVAQGGSGKSSKSGAKSVITTSSWRAGQELVARELGLPKPKSKEETRRGVSTPHDDPRHPDGAEGNITNSARVPAAGADNAGKPSASGKDYSAQLAQSRALSEDARKLFTDLQLDNHERPSSRRPAVKRKAPKEPREAVEKPVGPAEKQRHYDMESVRQFIAKKNAERHRQKEKAKRAEEAERLKRQQLMVELLTKQRFTSTTMNPASAAATTANTKTKKVKRAGKSKKMVSPSPGLANTEGYDQRIRTLLEEESDKENSELPRMMEEEEDDNSDADTLTGESEGSTPRADSRNDSKEEEAASERPAALGHSSSAAEHNLRPHSNNNNNDDLRLPNAAAAGGTPLTASADPNSLPTSHLTPSSSGPPVEFQGKKLHLDMDAVLSRFSQVCSQRQGDGGGRGGGEGASVAAASMHERLHSLRASSRTLQSRFTSTEAQMPRGTDAHPDMASAESPEPDFVPRYSRIAGSSDDFHVFTANLPGAQTHSRVARTATATSPERSPGPGVRASAQSERDSVSAALLPKSSPPGIAGGFHVSVDDDDSVTETSTFSEVTAAIDEWGTDATQQKTVEGMGRNVAQHAENRTENAAPYRAPTAGSGLRWEDPHADPYSVLNIFSRQHQHGLQGPSTPSSSRPQDSAGVSGRLKDPSLVSSKQVMLGRSAEGHPMMTTATYTRLEATLPADTSHASQPSARNRTARSEDRSERITQRSYPSRTRTLSEDTQSLESDEEDTPQAVSSRHLSRKSGVALRRQMSDTGQETDVSQLSEDEPRNRSYGRPIVDSSRHESGEARWSPAALERQLTAELARLESLEDSIRQLSSAERTRSVALAQQETVSVAQVLKARQQENSAQIRSLQLQAQEERLASAQQLQHTLAHTSAKGVQAPASDMSSLLSLHQPPAGNRQLLEKAENLRPEAKVTTATSLARSRGRDDTEYSETFTSVRDTKPSGRTASPTSSRSRSSVKTAEDSSTQVKTARDSSATVRTADDSAASIRTAEDLMTDVKTAEDSTESIKTAEDSQADSDYSIKTASDSERPRTAGSAVPEEVPGDYSLSFEESVTEDESYTKERSTDTRRKDTKNRKTAKMPLSEERSSHRVNDLISIYGGEDSFKHLSIDFVRNTMCEEEIRGQHQESLLRMRSKALKEKVRAQLSLLRQEKQQQTHKGPGDHEAQRELKRLADKEAAILRHLEEEKTEIDRMLKTEELAREHRQSLLKQHEQIAKMREETREKVQQLQGRLGRPAEVHTEDDTSMVEDLSDASDVSYVKDVKSDSEMTQRKTKAKGDKQKMEKQQKIRLDQKYLTVREQKLMERKKQASELLRWKQDLDAEEEKVLQLEHTALQAWEGRVSGPPSPTKSFDKRKDRSNAKREEKEKKVKASGNLRPEAGARSENAATPRTDTATTPRSAVDSYTAFSQSEAVSTHISGSESEKKSSPAGNSTPRSRAPRLGSSETSIAEDVPDGSEIPTQADSSPEKRDSSDDTIVNSSVNEEDETEVPTRGSSKGKKSPVGRLLPPGNSPLPQPWSRKTGSESESEESVSHTETQSDVSDYEVRIRQLSDMLGRRRKEAEMLKKERSRRMKEKYKAQEESLKKQVEAYDTYIAQVKKEHADLQQEGVGGKPAVPPKIKQPGPHPTKTRGSPTTSSPLPHARGQPLPTRGQRRQQLLLQLRRNRLNSKASPSPEKGRKKSSSSIMDRISEGSESASDRSRPDVVKKSRGDKTRASGSLSEASTLSEAIEEAVDDSASAASQSSPSAILNIQTSLLARADSQNETVAEDSGKKGGSVAEDNPSYSQDFSEAVSQSLAKSHSRVQTSEASARGTVKSEVSEAIESAVSTAKSDSSSAPRFDLKGPEATEKDKEASASSRPATGIQESDSESESRLNSHRTSRPSSERSTASTTYSDFHDFDQEEEEDIISSESDRTPVKVSASQKDKLSAHGAKAEEDISEHMSVVSLPSISEKKSSVSQATGIGHQNSIDAVLGDLLGDEDATPTQTPRVHTPPLDQEEGPDPLLMTDPLADFHEGDPVLVWGRMAGTLRFKGAVTFAPGHWAGVELKAAEGDTDGERDGKRYFACPPEHGLLVPGSDISALEEERKRTRSEELKSLDESFTEHDDVSSATEEEKTESASVVEEVKAEEKETVGDASAAKADESPRADRHNLALLAGGIVDDLTKSLVEDSMQTINTIAARQASPGEKTPPPTLPKPPSCEEKPPPLTLSKEEDTAAAALSPTTTTTTPSPKTPPPTLPKPQTSQQKTPPPTLPKPAKSPEKIPPPTLPKPQTSPTEKTPPPFLPEPQPKTTSNMMDGLVNEAISRMMHIRRSRQSSGQATKGTPASADLVNGLSDDSGVAPSHDSSLEPAPGVSPEPGEDEGRGPVSPELFQRPKSPVPVNSPTGQEEEEDEYDFSGLGDSQDFFDEDFGLSAKPPPPYPGAGDQARRGTGGPDSPSLAVKAAPAAEVFIVPHERSEVEAIVSDAVSVYWNLRRCGEPWEQAQPPPEFMQEARAPDGSGEHMEGMVTASRRTFKALIFDLTGDIVRNIYRHEHDPEPSPWQKAPAKRQRYYRGNTPPSTMDALLPVVQSAVTDILGLNGCSGKYRGKTANKWNVRKKKDYVDAVLVEELQEEEADWINYDADELSVKMQLTNTIFESLLDDTVSALNKVYAKKQRRLQTS